jgi:hypothetical protein
MSHARQPGGRFRGRAVRTVAESPRARRARGRARSSGSTALLYRDLLTCELRPGLEA